MVKTFCRYTGIEVTTTPNYFIQSVDYLHPKILIVKKELAAIDQFTEVLKGMSTTIMENISKGMLDYPLMREGQIITRIAVAILVNSNQDKEVIWKPETHIHLSELSITPEDLILEIKFLIFLLQNYNQIKLQFAFFDSMTTCKRVYEEVRLLHKGKLVFTKSNAPPAIVLRSYDTSLNAGDCENFVKLAQVSLEVKGDYHEYSCLGYHSAFRNWLDIKLLKKIHLAILNKDQEVYDQSDKLLQIYNMHLLKIGEFFFKFDVNMGVYLKTKHISPSKVVNSIALTF